MKLPFLVWTDHKNLVYISSNKRLNSRQGVHALTLLCLIALDPGTSSPTPFRGSLQMRKSPLGGPRASFLCSLSSPRLPGTLRKKFGQPRPHSRRPVHAQTTASTRCWSEHTSRGAGVSTLLACRRGYQRTLRITSSEVLETFLGRRRSGLRRGLCHLQSA